MVSFPRLRIGLWDPFQMAELHGLQMGVILSTYVRPGMILQVLLDAFFSLSPYTNFSLTHTHRKPPHDFFGGEQLSHENEQTGHLLSMKYWLFYRDPGSDSTNMTGD